MATRFAQPSANNWDWGSTSNWSATDGGSTGAAVPANGDDVYLKTGGYSLGTSNLDQSAVTLTSLNILQGYGGEASGVSIPSSASSSLRINATTLNIINNRVAYINLDGAFTTVYLRTLANGKLYITAGSAINIYAGANGYIELADDVETTLVSTAGTRMLIKADTTSPGDLELDVASGATVEVKRKITTGIIEGTLIMSDAATIDAASGTGKIKVGRGGKIDIRSSGALDEIVVMKGGDITSSNMPGFATAPVLAVLKLQDGAKKNTPADSLTITSTVFAGGYSDQPTA